MLRWSNVVAPLCGSSGASGAAASALHPQLRHIAEAMDNLARVTRGEMLSTTLEVLTVDGGNAFGPCRMLNKMREDEHDNEHGSIGADVGAIATPPRWGPQTRPTCCV